MNYAEPTDSVARWSFLVQLNKHKLTFRHKRLPWLILVYFENVVFVWIHVNLFAFFFFRIFVCWMLPPPTVNLWNNIKYLIAQVDCVIM